MSNEDFSIASLASYLHLEPGQVSRLADRGRLPGRKIAGKWRFSQAEIHHWLEDRIGTSGNQELDRVEGALRRADSRAGRDAAISISKLVLPTSVAVPLDSRTRSSVIESMVQLAAESGYLWEPDKMVEAVRARENLHPTALDNGVALLHPRRPMSSILAEPMVALGRTHQGIPFGGAHGGLTDIFFLVCSVDDRGHLHTLARLSRLVAESEFLMQLRLAEDAESALDVVRRFDAELNSM